MAEITTITLVCDRCGRKHDKATFENAPTYGETRIQYGGHISGRTWQGDAGGLTHKGNVWLCLGCTREFLEFMRPVASTPGERK